MLFYVLYGILSDYYQADALSARNTAVSAMCVCLGKPRPQRDFLFVHFLRQVMARVATSKVSTPPIAGDSSRPNRAGGIEAT